MVAPIKGSEVGDEVKAHWTKVELGTGGQMKAPPEASDPSREGNLAVLGSKVAI